MKQAMTQADLKAVNKAIDATESAVNKRNETPPAPEQRDMGPRIACKLLHFIQAMNIPGRRFEQYLERLDDPKRRQYLIDYLPKMQLFEVSFIPAPGDVTTSPEVEYYPREFASFRPL